MRRRIVQIDESKCDGCGLCVPACAEGAIEIVDGKARLVSDVYCDGLGACLVECPKDAISVVQREAEPFDEEAARQQAARAQAATPLAAGGPLPLTGACPGSTAASLQPGVDRPESSWSPERAPGETPAEPPPSGLRNWPVQLHLVPPDAPFLRDADLLLVADCVPFAMADFHQRFLHKRPVVIGCPKLDDARYYVEKLAHILSTANINSITVVQMEVPCCTRLARIAEQALLRSGSAASLEEVTIAIRGKILRRRAAD